MLQVTMTKGLPDVTLVLEGELDMATGDILREVVDGLDLEKLNSITFSLDGLAFIDSTGIGQLIGYYRSFAKHNTQVYINNNNKDIEEVLELVGVREIMKT
ncbi:MAG TPA: STAS domain-containing protein [Corynebacteriales bacterium]|jgi:stage II sporulation protein AA (anti-sigma F factor antagonist)|nr:STAS domain-containing protein [Bacillota bacterium]HHY08594.1 STAS domain-containing protein [Mycobacteriales bacterium]